MSKLNDYTKETEGVIHLMITDKCNRDCKYCCNKQYDTNLVPFVTDKELSKARMVFLTGGEPFAYSNPCDIAKSLKDRYDNIERVIVYTNALELSEYLKNNKLYSIDGLTVSIKSVCDKMAFEEISRNTDVKCLLSNWLYVFPGFEDVKPSGFDMKIRTWQTDFTPAPDSVFRRYGGIV